MSIKNKLLPQAVVEAVEARICMSADVPPVVVPSPPAENMLVILQQPRSAQEGQTMGQITVELFDPTGNQATRDNSNVTITGSALSGTTTVTAENGVAVFSDFTVNTTGSEVLTVSDGDLATVDTQPIVITNTVTAGQVILPITVNPWSAKAKWLKVKLVNTLNGKTTLTRTFYPRHGQAVLVNNLLSFVAGDMDVVASDSLGNHTTLEQVTVSPGAPRALWFSAQPRVLDADAIVTVTVLDQYGNVTTADDGDDLVLHSWLPKGTLGAAPVLTGNTTATVVGGVASFSGLEMDQPGKAHLIARLADLKPAVSNVFQAGASLTVDPINTGPVL